MGAHALLLQAHTICHVRQSFGYADVLLNSDEEKRSDRDAAVNMFVDSHIYSRMRAVCVHEPESEIAFVGTKLDLIRFDGDVAQRIEADLTQRLNSREKEVVRQLNDAIIELRQLDHGEAENLRRSTSLTNRLAELSALKTKRPRILSHELNVMSSADLTGVNSVRLALENLIVAGDTSFIMLPDSLELSAYIKNKAKAVETTSVKNQIETLFANVSALQDEFEAQPAFASVDITAILHTLHIIGGIL